MSSHNYLMFTIPSPESEYLQENHPNAFLLLCTIARRARRYSGLPDGLEIGEAHIGDYHKSGIESERQYRTAKDILIKRGHIKICETCRNRKKSTTGETTRGTLVKILKSDIWDINAKVKDDRRDDRPTTDRRPTDDEQERRIKKNKEEENKEQAQTTSSLRSDIYFCFEFKCFKNISKEDEQSWKNLYPAVDIPLELKKMVEWCLSEQSKAKSKKKWRSFINNWLRSNNEKSINKSAFQKNIPVDRRTKDLNGVPVQSPSTGRF